MARLVERLFCRTAQPEPSPSPLAVETAGREERVRHYMRHRWQRLCRQVGEPGTEALELLPFLLHVNLPGLPGYVPGRSCPCGVADYSPPARVLKAARRRFPEARVRRTGALRPAVDLVAVMGSAGTIGFTGESDLDVWVCHGPGLSPREADLLRSKVHAVERWLNENTGLEVHLFLQSTESIRANDFGQTDLEGCGSAMGALLKEEFYRTAIVLAGKLPLWWVVPAGLTPQAYAEHAEQMARDPTLVTDTYVDLGWVARVPLGELFGAAVWQIVKGWHAPFKSALKMGLLEKVVSTDLPVPPLCETLKERVHAGDRPDPYCVLFDAVLEHYRAAGDIEAEDLLARCFYLKTGIRLDPERLEALQEDPGDAGVMARYVARWGWGPRTLRHLNEFGQWRFEWVVDLARDVDRFFLRAYQRIRTALERAGETQRITARDLTVLGRTLQVLYRRIPNKVETLHRIADRVEEAQLTLLQESLPRGEVFWRLYRGWVTPATAEQRLHDVLREGSDPMELLVWAAHNRLLGSKTALATWPQGESPAAAEAEQVARTLVEFRQRWGGHGAAAPQHLLERPRTRALIVVLNFGLPVGRVRQVGAVYTTTWGEVFYRRWQGAEALDRFLEESLVPFLLDGGEAGTFRAVCPSRAPGGGGALHRLERTLPALAEFLGGKGPPAGVRRRYLLKEEGRYLILDRPGPDACRLHVLFDQESALRFLSGVGPYHRVETRIERQAGDPAVLATVFEAAEYGRIDVFVLREADRETLFVVDEVGNLSVSHHVPEPHLYALARLLLFLENVFPEVAVQPGSPLAGRVVLEEVLRIHILVYDGTCRAFTATQDHLHRVRALGLRPTGLVIERSGGGGYRIQWGDQIIDSRQYPDPLGEVRRRILKSRRSGGSYDVFVTRLFLDEAFRRQHCGAFATMGHYLFYKRAIEHRLSA